MASGYASGSAVTAGTAAILMLCLAFCAARADDGRSSGPGPGPASQGFSGQPAQGQASAQSRENPPGSNRRGTATDSRSRVLKSSNPENGEPKRRAGWFDHNDALNARNAGQIISLKQAIDATNSPGSKVIEVKLFGNANHAVYRIKLMDQDGTIRTVRINAITAEPAGLF